MSKWINLVTNAIIELGCHIRKYGQGEIVIRGYKEHNGRVRFKLIRKPEIVDEFFDDGITED